MPYRSLDHWMSCRQPIHQPGVCRSERAFSLTPWFLFLRRPSRAGRIRLAAVCISSSREDWSKGGRHMDDQYMYVDHAVSAIEKSNLDQVLSSKRPCSIEMRSTIRCGVCSTCLTFLVPPDSAGGGDLHRRRPRPCSRRFPATGVVFVFLSIAVRSLVYLVRTDTYQFDVCRERNWVVQFNRQL